MEKENERKEKGNPPPSPGVERDELFFPCIGPGWERKGGPSKGGNNQ